MNYTEEQIQYLASCCQTAALPENKLKLIRTVESSIAIQSMVNASDTADLLELGYRTLADVRLLEETEFNQLMEIVAEVKTNRQEGMK